MTVLKISKLRGFVWKTMQAWLDSKSCFNQTNASNFWQPLQSLIWDIRLKILRLANFKSFKSELFSCLAEVDHVIKSCKESILKHVVRSRLSLNLLSSLFFGTDVENIHLESGNPVKIYTRFLSRSFSFTP